MARVVLAMSGGVDSSVAAHLLLRAGHEVIGLFMRHGEPAPALACAQDERQGGVSTALPTLPIVATSHKQGCCTASDAADARRVADKLSIPFYALDFRAEFQRIIDYFSDEYAAGRTPNPCVLCNNWLKFGQLLDYAEGIGADYIATGHYARLAPASVPSEFPALLRGVDPGKDQSYVLFGLKREILHKVLLPIGEYHKPQIRELARELGLRVADKKDSQEICFVPDNDHVEFLRRKQGGLTAGEIVALDGRVLGRHEGIEGFTIGQRKGLGIAFGEPQYVVRIEAQTRRVVIGPREALVRTSLTARDANWLIEPPREPLECTVKIRYLSQPAQACVRCLADERLQIDLLEPKTGVAPGQAVVCYDHDRVLGGGWIE